MLRNVLSTSAVLLFASCGSYTTVRGSGTVLMEERVVQNFHGVKVSGGADVFLSQGGVESLSVECDDNLLPHIRSEVVDGILEIGFERGSWSPSQSTIYRINVRDIDLLMLSGSVDVQCDRLQVESLKFKRSGSGSLTLGSLEATTASFATSGSGSIAIDRMVGTDVKYSVSGSGKITVGAGQVETFNASASGSGKVRMIGVQIQNAQVKISGSGSADLWVDQTLDVKISGSGIVQYVGQPSVEGDISGSGKVRVMPESGR